MKEICEVEERSKVNWRKEVKERRKEVKAGMKAGRIWRKDVEEMK